MAPLGLADRIELEPAEALDVTGFDEDTLVRGALEALATAADTETRWRVAIEKEIPVAAGLGGGSSDAAAALQLANETLDEPLPDVRLHELAATLGADIPFFLAPGPKLARGDGTVLEPLELSRTSPSYSCAPGRRARRTRPAAVYREFDARAASRLRGARARCAALCVARRMTWRALPPNDLASSPHAARLLELGAFRADVTGAGPAVYGALRRRRAAAEAARGRSQPLGRVWVDNPVGNRATCDRSRRLQSRRARVDRARGLWLRSAGSGSPSGSRSSRDCWWRRARHPPLGGRRRSPRSPLALLFLRRARVQLADACARSTWIVAASQLPSSCVPACSSSSRRRDRRSRAARDRGAGRRSSRTGRVTLDLDSQLWGVAKR